MIVEIKDVYEDSIFFDLKLGEKELIDWDEQIDQIEVFVEVLNIIQVIKIKMEELY